MRLRERVTVHRVFTVGLLAGFLLVCCAGCGAQRKDQREESKEIIRDTTLCIAEDYRSETVQHQLEVLVENADKWRIAGDEDRTDDEIGYAVTDLDRNGRLEIIACYNDWTEDSNILQKLFEVNDSGDGVQEITADQIGEVSLGDMLENLDTAYYDPKTGECHYVMGTELTEEEMLSDESEDYEKEIIALTIKPGKIILDTLACQIQTKNQTGKMQSRFYRIDGTEKTEMDPAQYNVESMGDAVYSDCEKFTVCFALFFFDHSLEDMTEKQLHHALEKSYRESFMGYPLGKQEKKAAGQKIRIPQYSTMQDAGKQKRINQMIVKQVEQSLRQFDDLQGAKGNRNVNITVKYAGWDRVSLLLQMTKSHKTGSQEDTESLGEMVQGAVVYDTVNIDLEQENTLSKGDLVPESYREEVEEDIEDDVKEEVEKWEELDQKQNSDDLYRDLMDRLEKWQEISLYQTRDMIGVVIPTGLVSEPYVICEAWNDWDAPGSCWYDGVSYAEVDWEAYQYKMLASEYQDLQDYMPLLTEGAEFIYQYAWDEDDKEVVKKKNMTISSWIKNLFGEEVMPENMPVYAVCICDLTRDGKAELVLDVISGVRLVLHREGDIYYGKLYGIRSLEDLRKNGVHGAGKGTWFLCQIGFEKDHFVDDYLGQSVQYTQGEEIKMKYYIQDQRVGKKAYKKWEKSVMDEAVSWYNPEALVED